MFKNIKNFNLVKISVIVFIFVNTVFLLVLNTSTRTKVINPNWIYSTALEGSKSFYQWQSDQNNKLFPDTDIRGMISDTHPFPKIIREKDKAIKLTFLSSLKDLDDPNHTLCIIYDDWAKSHVLKNSLQQFQRNNNERTILVDVSSTMNQKDKNAKINRLEQVYHALVEKKKTNSEKWKLYTFSDNLVSIGNWKNGKNLFSHLQKGKGRTYLLKALSELKKDLNKPTHISVITDGHMTETDRSSYESTLVSLSAEGHSISILSPTLNRTDSLTEFYNRGLLSSEWEKNTVEQQKNTEKTSRLSNTVWKNVLLCKGNEYLKPFIWSKKGVPLAFIETTQLGKIVHLAGQPTDGGAELQKILNQQFNSIIIFSANHSKLEIDIRNHRFQTLKIWKGKWVSLDSVYSGIFSFSAQEFKNLAEYKFFHPTTGFFRIENLSSLKQIKKGFPKEITENITFEVFSGIFKHSDLKFIYFIVAMNVAFIVGILLMRKYRVLNS
jgi:hypothetical protein